MIKIDFFFTGHTIGGASDKKMELIKKEWNTLEDVLNQKFIGITASLLLSYNFTGVIELKDDTDTKDSIMIKKFIESNHPEMLSLPPYNQPAT